MLWVEQYEERRKVFSGLLRSKSRMTAISAPRRAIVLGGSIAGLLAARVLSDFFDEIIVIERDRHPQEIAVRNGAPQARHVHTLLMRGQQIVERLFPGFEADLAEAGAPALEWTSDAWGWSSAGWLPRFHSPLKTHSCSRELLEGTILRRLADYTNIHLLENTDVIGLLPDATNSGIAGVRVRQRPGSDTLVALALVAPATVPVREGRSDGEEDLLADFVVDASGRESKAADWLEALGYPRPAETTINAFLGYASRVYQRPADLQTEWKAVLIGSMPPKTLHGGVIYPIEGDRWLVTLAGRAKQYPPTDEAGFLEFARTCANPLIYDAIKDATPLTPIVGYRRTENRLRHYERLERFPERFVVLGDAVCAFNPVYGQGMTTAALGAETLGQMVQAERQRHPSGDLTGLSRRFQQMLAKVTATPWLMATGEDLRTPGVEGGQALQRGSAIRRWLRAYLERVRMLSARDAATFQVFLEVAHLLRKPTAFFHPRIAAKVLWHKIKYPL
jgi:2-polyprenyl-6-methoxyphenol hydroxylase-like FAD-dependent oxidoreductase